MDLRGAVAVVTGGASGIGAALAARFVAEGAATVVVADRHAEAARACAATLNAAAPPRTGGEPVVVGLGVDVTDESAVTGAIAGIEAARGPIDLWCSNAGVATGTDLATDDDWETSWQVHVLAHVYAARAVLPGMVARGRGHFLVTASAAGLLTEMDAAPYAVTKHGSVAIAEWLAIRYGGETGVGFSCLC